MRIRSEDDSTVKLQVIFIMKASMTTFLFFKFYFLINRSMHVFLHYNRTAGEFFYFKNAQKKCYVKVILYNNVSTQNVDYG